MLSTANVSDYTVLECTHTHLLYTEQLITNLAITTFKETALSQMHINTHGFSCHGTRNQLTIIFNHSITYVLKTSLILVVEKVGAEEATAPPTLKAEGQSTPKIMDGDVTYMVKIL